MGTRAIIEVEGVEFASVYQHWDGYPEATLPWLESFNAKFAENRGNDPQYKIAQLLRDSQRSAGEFDLDDSEYTGWGLVPYGADMGQDYVYCLHSDGTVTYHQ